jgi:hypothetical protein
VKPQPDCRLNHPPLLPAGSWTLDGQLPAGTRTGWPREPQRPIPARVRLALQRLRCLARRHSRTLDVLIALLAIGGMTASVLVDLPVRSSAFAGSDMKTLFASVWCFVHGHNAYTISNVQSVFAAQKVVFPESWFGHAPVYPPTTLAVLMPLAALPMVAAVYAVVIGSAALYAIAVVVLLRRAGEDGCPLPARAAIAVLCACCPLFAFALSMGNVSVAASALCIIAFVRREHGSTWLGATLLAIAVLLKPHLAIWMLTGMLLLPERAARRVAVQASVLIASFTALVVAGLVATHKLGMQLHGFASILSAETASGSSMSTSSHEVIPICAQITSLHSLLGFWWQSSAAQSAVAIALLLSLGYFVSRLDSEAMPAIGAWLAFGLLATYHRAHDAVILVILLPWLVETIRRAPRLWYSWALILLYVALNLSASFDVVRLRIADGQYNGFITFLLLRQAALANLGLLLVLLAGMARRTRMRRRFRLAQEASPTLHVYSAS